MVGTVEGVVLLLEDTMVVLLPCPAKDHHLLVDLVQGYSLQDSLAIRVSNNSNNNHRLKDIMAALVLVALLLEVAVGTMGTPLTLKTLFKDPLVNHNLEQPLLVQDMDRHLLALED